VRLGDLHPHDPEIEAGVDEVAGDSRLLVHLPDEGRTFSSAKSRTTSRKAFSSSERSVSGRLRSVSTSGLLGRSC